jgi:osmotically-inducible protein OsmY
MSRQDPAAAIRRALALDPTVNIQDVQVQVVDGHATLIGMVATLEEKEAADRAAAHVAGIRRVENRLTVAAEQLLSDREITEEVDTALETLPADQHRTLGAVVAEGTAHLVGHARSAAVVEAAHEIAAGVEGVEEVVSDVQIDAGAPMDAASVTNRVIQALAQSSEMTPSPIDVETADGEVVLDGIVVSEEERERAAEIARAVPGVARVTNRLKVGELRYAR